MQVSQVLYLFNVPVDGQCQTDGHESMRDMLGGKGANLAGMSRLGFPVPAGCTVPTSFCQEYAKSPVVTTKKVVRQVYLQYMLRMEKALGYRPLVSVRSGARVSMPGMMDTILNVGMTTDVLDEWVPRIGPRPAIDSYRRLIQMYGTMVKGIDNSLFEQVLVKARTDAGVATDAEIPVGDLGSVLKEFLALYLVKTGEGFPQTFEEQLAGAVQAVWRSWDSERAKHYRKMYGFSDDWGTAVNVQAMVFGNAGPTSGSGVVFSRDPATGEPGMVGEYLPDAQGEDVVAGIRTPQPVKSLVKAPGDLYEKLASMVESLEQHFYDAQDVEFTVQDGKLFLLQTRSMKRTAQAAVKIVVDMVSEGLISQEQAFQRLKVEDFYRAQIPMLDPKFKKAPDTVGLPACPGVAKGVIALSSKMAVQLAKSGKRVVLVAEETTPEDIAGMEAAVGVLTRTGGSTSHAAVVARAMNRPCIVGCGLLSFVETAVSVEGATVVYPEGTQIVIDGSTGNVWFDADPPLIDGVQQDGLRTLLRWMAAKSGRMVRGVDVTTPEAQYVSLAEVWLLRGYAGLTNLLDTVEKLENRTGIVLDIDVSCFTEEAVSDHLLWHAFSNQPLPFDSSQLLKLLSGWKLHGVRLVNAPVLSKADLKLVNKMGAVIVNRAQTLADLFEPGFVVDDQFLANVVGSPETLEWLKKVLVEKGLAMPFAPSGATMIELARLTLAK